jgi:hypothetical protein
MVRTTIHITDMNLTASLSLAPAPAPLNGGVVSQNCEAPLH